MTAVIAFVAGSIVLMGVLLYRLWPGLVFRPVYHAARDAFHLYPERFHPLSLIRDQSIALEGVVYAPDEARCTLLYFGGREQDSVALVGRLSERFPLCRIVSFNYRGYGRSGGTPTEPKLLDDAVAVTRYVKERYGAVCLMGYSLGASMAAFAASREPVEKLILVAPFYDLHTLARSRFGPIPSWLLRCRFETGRYLNGVEAPVALFAATDDEIVPVEQSRDLKRHVSHLALSKEFSGYNHEELLWSDALRKELEKVFDG